MTRRALWTGMLLALCASASAQTRAGMMNVGDASVNYELVGRGPETVVFIHGWALNLGVWNSQVAALSPSYRVLRYDSRGFAKSTGSADVTADPEDLRILLDSLGIRSAHIVGHSRGSRVAETFAVMYPERTASLVLYGAPPMAGFPVSPATDPRRLVSDFSQIARTYGLDSLRKAIVHSDLAWHPPNRPDLDEALRKTLATYDARDLLDPKPASGRVTLASFDALTRLNVPTLIIHGDHEIPAMLAVADTLTRRMPNARRVVVKDAGHGAHGAQPALFNRALLDFFASVRSPRAFPSEGYIAIPAGKIWYRVVGSGARTPVLLVHGCCGVGSYYMKPLEALADERPVVFFDMIDNGRSDHPGDTTNWRMAQFTDEITRVREALGLKEIHLYGHSFGANVATDYMLTRPPGVKSVTLAGAQIDMTRADADMRVRFASLPDSVQRAVIEHEKAGTVNAPQYMAAVFEFLHRFHARRLPWSADIDSSVAHINWPMGAYMYGPSLFELGGVMKSYDRTSQLASITTPTLITIGEYDYTLPESARDLQRRIPDSRLVIVANSGHLMMHDDPVGHVRTLREFLRSTEP